MTPDDSLRDLLLDHRYTGPLDKTHQDDIIGTIQVRMIKKLLLYLREFCEGLKLFNVDADYGFFRCYPRFMQLREHQGSWRRK